MRAARRTVSPTECRVASSRILAGLRALPQFRAARLIATFFPFDGEPDLTPLLRNDSTKRYCVPVIGGDQMQFALLHSNEALVPNHFGILEPQRPDIVDARTLDLVLTPLVAFDNNGVRLGVGRGYYDRRFAFLRSRSAWFRPKLLGIAYSFQQLPSLDAREWDVPLWGVVTESGAQIWR